MSSGGSGSPRVSVRDTNTGLMYDFYDNTTFQQFQQYLIQSTDAVSSSLMPLLDEFKKYPHVDQVLAAYLDEALRSCDANLRIAGSVLVGCLSELLVLHVLKAVGEFLGDANTVQNYMNKRKNIQGQLDFTKTMVQKARSRLEGSRALTTAESTAFREFNGIVGHVFDSIRLTRNDYAHPTPDTSLNDLPLADVVKTHVQSFNPYAKKLLTLVDTFMNAAVPVAQPSPPQASPNPTPTQPL